MTHETPQIITELSSIVEYNRETGLMIWLEAPKSFFPSEHSWRIWTAKCVGLPAFATPQGKGYLQGRFKRRLYKAHRVAWAIHYGCWPINEIDHKDRNRSNNSIANLRDVTRAENMRNKSTYKNNTSGVTGVYHDKRDNKYCAYISDNGTILQLGRFDIRSAAVKARNIAEKKHDYT